MAVLQELNIGQIDDAINCAVERTVPITVTVQHEGRWLNLRSRAIGVRDGKLVIEPPTAWTDEAAPEEFTPAEKLGMGFKLKHHKHIFTATVAGLIRWKLDDGTEVPALAVCWPTRMQRLQRRAFFRAEVPANRIVRASFWVGGCEAEPKGVSPTTPVWSGRVMNLSAGGFQAIISDQPIDSLDVGDTVGVRLSFGTSNETVYADAQFRHVEPQEEGLIMGFQFLGLAQTADGKRALQLISIKVNEFQKASAHRVAD